MRFAGDMVSTLDTPFHVCPRARMLGAVSLQGYLGGAAASQVRTGTDSFPLVFHPVSYAQALGRPRHSRTLQGARVA